MKKHTLARVCDAGLGRPRRTVATDPPMNDIYMNVQDAFRAARGVVDALLDMDATMRTLLRGPHAPDPVFLTRDFHAWYWTCTQCCDFCTNASFTGSSAIHLEVR